MRRIAAICLSILFTHSFALAADNVPTTLRAVAAVDAVEAWAVGDAGVILHTIDAGKTWERQPSGTTAKLNGIEMLTPYVGFVVGRTDVPGPVGSLGIVLKTEDGGATWKEIPNSALPGLHAVKFFDGQHGYLAGTSTDSGPTASYLTADGGQTWEALNGTRNLGWNAILPMTATTALLAGKAGVAAVRDERFSMVPGLTKPVAALLRDKQQMLVIHADGSCIALDETGKTDAASQIAPSSGFQVRSACSVRSTVWAIGMPGSVVFRSNDFGKTWTSTATPTTATLHHISMIDAMQGYAVGDYGTILQTKDGGTNWIVCQSSGSQASITLIVQELTPELLPIVAKFSRCDGYHTAVIVRQPCDESRMAQAWHAAGNRGLVVVAPTDATLLAALQSQRPAVVLTDCDDVEALTAKLGVPADQLHLKPHKVTKVVRFTRTKTVPAIDPNQFVPELGMTLNDRAEAGMRLLAERPDYNTSLTWPNQEQDLFAGITMVERSPARGVRLVAPAFDEATTAEQARFCKLHNEIMAELDKAATPAEQTKCYANLMKQIETWPGDIACRTVLRFAEAAENAGKILLARSCYAWIVERHGIRTEAALVIPRLLRLHGSMELRKHLMNQELALPFEKVFEKNPNATEIQQTTALDLNTALTSTAKTRFVSGQAARQWEEYGLSLDARLAAFGAAYLRESSGRLARVSLQRRLGFVADAERALRMQLAVNSSDAKADIMTTRYREELRLLLDESTEQPQIPRWPNYVSKTKPVLDGQLTDDCWVNAKLIVMPNAPAGENTTTRFAFDENFLYFAVECTTKNPKHAEKATKRSYDADLNAHDRVEIQLDVDRDYGSYFTLAIDERGCTADDCTGDKTWNPRWFVATGATEQGWIVEAAIPITELVDGGKISGQTWNVTVIRKQPNKPATKPTQGFLKFIDK